MNILVSEREWPQIDFLEIDAEGFDSRVMKQTGHLWHLVLSGGLARFEYNNRWRFAGSTLYSVYRLLEDAGHKVIMLRHDGPYDFDYWRYG